MFGLKSDGTILCKYPISNRQWPNSIYQNQLGGEPDHVVAIDSSEFVFTCLKSDGTVLVAGSETYYDEFRNKVSELSNVVQAVALDNSIVVRFADGSVRVLDCYEGDYDDEEVREIMEAVAKWSNIKQIYTDHTQLFALDSAGRVHYAGKLSEYSNINPDHIELWRDIVNMRVRQSYDGSYILAWQSNGTLLTEGLTETCYDD